MCAFKVLKSAFEGRVRQLVRVQVPFAALQKGAVAKIIRLDDFCDASLSMYKKPERIFCFHDSFWFFCAL